MDLAYDFIPKGQNNNMNMNNKQNTNMNNNMNQNEVNRNNDMNANQAVNQSPYVKLSLDNDDYKNFQAMDEEAKRRVMMENNNAVMPPNSNMGGGNEIDQLTQQVKVMNANKKIIKKTVEITTKITYTYEDGSTKEVNEVKTHVFSA